MGISGLLPFIKNSCRSANVRDFRGATVAIDAYSWLHKGAFSCAEKLVKGEKTDGYVYYCARLLNMLLDAGVKPIMVFDGCNLRSKEVTEKKRKENREKTRQRGKELLCEGKVKEARECFQRCVDVTPEMAREVIEMCRKKNIDCIVAPYEADAQLAYLAKIEMAQIIITEDSDLVLFGCNKILFKMDGFGGGLLYEKENLPKSFGSNASKFSFEKFRYMCILSGCDYLPSLPGIGLAKACKFFMLTTNPDLSIILKKLPSYLKMPKLEVSEEYIDSFIKANNTFLHQLVFCPQKKALVPLTPYPEGVDACDMEYAGKYLPEDIAVELALGNINVKTFEKFDESDNSFVDKSAVWGSSQDSSENKPLKKVECSGFKFNSQKIKSSKRKAECLKTEKEEPVCNDDEELFAMYLNVKSKPDYDGEEEDPLAEVSPKKPKLSSLVSLVKSETDSKDNLCKDEEIPSLKRVVKSRFFASKSQSTEISGVLRENSPENLSNTVVSLDIPAEVSMDNQNIGNENIEILKPPSPVKSNKENISHMFAKKKAVDSKPSGSSTFDDITSSLTKVEHSWLDVLDTECSTVSSSGMSAKVLSLSAGERSKKESSNKHSVKIKKTKLISTKILDFKWNKESTFKTDMNSSLRSDGHSLHESSIESEEDVDVVLNTSQNVVSPGSSIFNSSKISEDCDVSDNKLCDQSFDDLPSSSASTSGISSSRSSTSSETVITPVNLKSFNSKPIGKPGKCRQIGLSKKSKSLDKKVSIKETLMNFNFIRKPKCEATSPT